MLGYKINRWYANQSSISMGITGPSSWTNRIERDRIL